MYESVVLVADSDEARRRSRIGLLQGAGFQAVGAANASELLECADRYRPAVAVLSGKLSGPAPSELCRQPRARAAAPLVLSLASAESPAWEGADLYLREPLAPRELLATISTCVRLRQRECELNDAQRLAGVGSWKWDADTDTVTWSEELFRIFGLDPASPAPGLGNISMFFAPENTALLSTRIERALSLGEPYELELEAVRPDGASFWVICRGEPRRDARGRIVGLRGTGQDITERKRMDEALRASEDRLRFVLACSRGGVWELDLRTGAYIFSDEIYPLFGFDRNRKNLREADWLALIHPEDRDRIEESWRKDTSQASGPVSAEYRIIHPERGVRWISGWAGLERDAAGRLVRVGGISFDITDRKRTEEALRSSEANFRQLVETAQEGIWMVDAVGRTKYANQRMAEMLGCALRDLQGHSVFEFTFEEDREAAMGLFRQCLAGNRMQFDFRLRRPDGDELWTGVSANRIASDSGEPRGVLALFSDVTERRRAEQALREADRRKDEFLAMLAHELRNPLAPIRNAVRIMRGLGPEDQVTLDWARGVIDRQVGHLARLVDDLLDVSRLVRGRLELRRESVDLAEVVERTLEVVRPLIQSHRHELVVSLPAEALRVEADPTRLTQVLANLLTNAAKYTPPGGRIRLEAEPQDGHAVIRVHDNGMGIPESLLPHVFDLFTQNERSLDRSQGGLGIGLTIVKRLVEKHGGEIAVQSDSRGSEFTVRLPLGRGRPGAARPETPNDTPRPTGTARRILVVDDNEDARDSLDLLLRLDGHEIRKAADGPAALAAAPEFRPDVVLLDIGLPGMDGYEVARRLREQSSTRGALLVAITGYGQPDDRLRAEAAGFDHHLVKPVDPEALGRVLAEARE